jgi:hypothetical protein
LAAGNGKDTEAGILAVIVGTANFENCDYTADHERIRFER